jgi:hypothetical protein
MPKGVYEHLQAGRGAFAVSGGGLLGGAAPGIERRRAFEMGSRPLEPDQANVVQVNKNRGHRTAVARVCVGRLGAPGTGIEVREEELIHTGAGGEGLQQDFTDISSRQEFDAALGILVCGATRESRALAQDCAKPVVSSMQILSGGVRR